MKAPKFVLALLTFALMSASLTWAADDKDRSDIEKRIDKSADVLSEVMSTPDHAIPDKMERSPSNRCHRRKLGASAWRPGNRSGAGIYG